MVVLSGSVQAHRSAAFVQVLWIVDGLGLQAVAVVGVLRAIELRLPGADQDAVGEIGKVPRYADPAGQAAYPKSLRELVVAALEEPGLLERFAAARDAEDLGRLRPALPHLTGVPADPDLWVRVTTGRARMTVAGDGEGGVVSRFTAAGQEGDFAPAVAPLLRRLLEGGWVPLAELAKLAELSVADAAVVVAELVAMQAATVRAGQQ